MLITAKVNYGMRALVHLARFDGAAKSEDLASAQALPAGFLKSILGDLRRTGILVSQRGTDGGYRLARPPSDITVGEVVRALDGTMTDVGGRHVGTQDEASLHIDEVWRVVGARLTETLDGVTLEDVALGQLPSWAAQHAGLAGLPTPARMSMP